MWALRASAMAAGGAAAQAFSRRSVLPSVNLRSSFRTSPLVAPFTSSSGMDRCVVYSSNTNEWEKVETDFDWGIFCAKEEGMLVNGRLHWHGFGKKIVAIVSLDLKSAEIGSMEHPRGGLPLRVITRDLVGRRLSLGVIGGCLSVAHHRRKRGEKLDVWVMKEYKDCSSWYRAMAVRLDHLIRPYYQPCLYIKTAFGMPRGGIANVLGQAPGGEILISYESFFLACHPKPKKKKGKGAVVSTLKEIENCGRVRAHLYFETLVSPKRILGQNVM